MIKMIVIFLLEVIAMKILDNSKGGGNINENLQRAIKSEEGKIYPIIK